MDTVGSKKLNIMDLGCMDYAKALEVQQRVVAQRIKGRCPDTLILVEHPPTVTIGRSGDHTDLRVSQAMLDQKGVCLHQVDRGGRATFHGPGQLVAYPIVKIEEKGVHAFLDQLLNTVADVLKQFHLTPEFKDGHPGIWVNKGKIASVGLSVKKQVTYHGIALNVNTDPECFNIIDPCGMKKGKIASMSHELNDSLALSAVKTRFIDHFSNRLNYSPNETLGENLSEKTVKPTGVKQMKRPEWMIKPATDLTAVAAMEKRLKKSNLATVCQSAHCPNLGECFGLGNATFMILGTSCTRRCRFCAVDKGRPLPVDAEEPKRVAMAVKELGLSHAVVTSVTRDDLPDGGAAHFCQTIDQIRHICSGVTVEVLVPDFKGQVSAMDSVCAASPDVFNHNIETVPRLYGDIRPVARYRRSLAVLSYAASKGLVVKSGLMLGLGETQEEIKKVLRDLKVAGCALLTLGQYLAPSKDHVPMDRYVTPEEFDMWAGIARNYGFKSVASGPLVRSSYRAGEMIGRAGATCHKTSIRKAG